MKPKNLKYPFSWEERRVLIQDRVWFVPVYYDKYNEFSFPGWYAPEMFGNDNPVYVEYCSGNGTWLEAKAKQDPNINWLGVEMLFERVRKIWSKIKNGALKNMMVLSGEAYTSTHHYFPDNSVDAMFINFPDPWPKEKHEKHRLMKPAFVEEMCRALKPGGTVTLVTDDAAYSEQMIEVMRGNAGFESQFEAPYYVNEMPEYGTSFFDELWRSKGKAIRYHIFAKKAAS